MNLREFKLVVLHKALILAHSAGISLATAKRRVARDVALEHKRKIATQKGSSGIPEKPLHQAFNGDETTTAKARLTAMLSRILDNAAHDERRERERQANAALFLDSGIPETSVVSALDKPSSLVSRIADAVLAPEPAPERTYDPGMVITGPFGGRSSNLIDEAMFLPRFIDRTTANHRASIERNERLQQERDARDRELQRNSNS
jgi:hypothetical protein